MDKYFDVIKGELIEEEEEPEKDTEEQEPTTQMMSLNAESTYNNGDLRDLSIEDDPS